MRAGRSCRNPAQKRSECTCMHLLRTPTSVRSRLVRTERGPDDDHVVRDVALVDVDLFGDRLRMSQLATEAGFARQRASDKAARRSPPPTLCHEPTAD